MKVHIQYSKSEIKALNLKHHAVPKLKAGDIIQCSFFDNTPKARKYGYQVPCTVVEVRPRDSQCQSGYVMKLRWPDGFEYDGLDVGWANMPLHVTKKNKTKPATPQLPAQFEMFQ